MVFWIVGGVLGAMIGVMLVAWAYGLHRGNAGWTDVFWTFGSGVALVAAALCPAGTPEGELGPRAWLVAAFMAAWSLRLGLYLAPRVSGHPEDPRYAAFRSQWGERYVINMLFVTLPQAPATALLSLSVVLAARRPEPTLDVRDLLAVLIFVAALVGEAVADGQMKRFRADPANRGKVIDTGLWGWSRHPNYVFQWLGWMAFPVMALDPALPLSWLTLSAPAVMYVLLRYVSGVPPLETAMLQSRGELFRAYQARVPVFFPFPARKPS